MPPRCPTNGGTASTSRLESPGCRSHGGEGDFGSVLDEVQPLLDPATPETAEEVVFGNDARAVALMNLGAIELWSFRHDEAERHLEQGLELARRIGRPYVQIGCLAYLALATGQRSFVGERERCLEAIAIAEAHGWDAEPIACIALGDARRLRRVPGPVRGGAGLAGASRTGAAA